MTDLFSEREPAPEAPPTEPETEPEVEPAEPATPEQLDDAGAEGGAS